MLSRTPRVRKGIWFRSVRPPPRTSSYVGYVEVGIRNALLCLCHVGHIASDLFGSYVQSGRELVDDQSTSWRCGHEERGRRRGRGRESVDTAEERQGEEWVHVPCDLVISAFLHVSARRVVARTFTRPQALSRGACRMGRLQGAQGLPERAGRTQEGGSKRQAAS